MTIWIPEWKVTVNGGIDYTNLTLANLTITSGRTDIYSQARAGYCAIEIMNLDESPITMNVNDAVVISVKDSTGVYVNLFGGDITDIEVTINSSNVSVVTQSIRITALGALSKLPVSLTEGVLSKAFDGDQIYTILEQVLFNTWAEVPAAETWSGYDPVIDWANAENSGLGEIDRPGDYELTARSASTTDIYSLVNLLANSGLGYLYEDSQGRISYADSTHRNEYLTANGYTVISAGTALTSGISTITRVADIRNKVTINYKANAQTSAEDLSSIAVYGQQAQNIMTTLENGTDAVIQANFYLGLRAYPQAQFQAITFTLGNNNIDDADRDALLNVFMGLPVDIIDLPSNITYGRFQGFIEGWTFSAGYNRLDLTLVLSPLAYSLQAVRWNGVSVAEAWNTLSPTLTWNDATVVA